MAKIKSIIQIVGTIKGITYYFLNGDYVSRKSSPPTKDQIYNDPRFATVKANTQEFGVASRMSKAIRNGLGENENLFKDNRLSSRLTAVCHRILQQGRGEKGQRLGHLSNMPEALKGFQLQKDQHFNKTFPAEIMTTTDDKQRLITISIPKVNLLPKEGFSSSTTHFRLIASVSTVSSHKWHRRSRKYKPTLPKVNGLGAMAVTPPLVYNKEYQNINLVVENPINPSRFQFPIFKFFSSSVSRHTAITVWIGITFGSMDGTTYNLQKGPRAMECIAVL